MGGLPMGGIRGGIPACIVSTARATLDSMMRWNKIVDGFQAFAFEARLTAKPPPERRMLISAQSAFNGGMPVHPQFIVLIGKQAAA